MEITAKIGQPIELRSCPAGLALFNTSVIWVAAFNSAAGSRDATDAATGKRFTGGALNEMARGGLLVRPLALVNGIFR